MTRDHGTRTASRPHGGGHAGVRAATLDRFTDSEIPVPDGSFAAEVRAFYTAWRSELAA